MWPFSRRAATPADDSAAPSSSIAPDEDPVASAASGSVAGPSGRVVSPAELATMPRPHRCNARVEDFVQAVVTWDYAGKIQPTWRLMRQCFKSEPGQEPGDPYLVIKDPQAYLDPRRLYSPRPNMERS